MSQQRPRAEEERGEPFAPAFLLCHTTKALKHKIKHLLWPGEPEAYGIWPLRAGMGAGRHVRLAEDALVLVEASRLTAKAGPSVSTASVLVTAAAPRLGTQGHRAMGLATFQLLSHLQHPSAAPCSAEASQGCGKHSELA